MENPSQEKILQQVLSEAWNNPSYKTELINNPEKAVRSLTGEYFEFPKGKTLHVCDQSNAEKVFLNIPVKPNLDNVELTDHQLEEVAGGLYPRSFTDGCVDFPFPGTGPYDPTPTSDVE